MIHVSNHRVKNSCAQATADSLCSRRSQLQRLVSSSNFELPDMHVPDLQHALVARSRQIQSPLAMTKLHVLHRLSAQPLPSLRPLEKTACRWTRYEEGLSA